MSWIYLVANGIIFLAAAIFVSISISREELFMPLNTVWNVLRIFLYLCVGYAFLVFIIGSLAYSIPGFIQRIFVR